MRGNGTVVAIHSVLGFITLIVAALMLIWNVIRLRKEGTGRPSFYRVLVGLLDLQALLGIITLALHPRGGWWLLHPLFMLAAVAVGHITLKEKRSRVRQLNGLVAILVLILIGAWLGNAL